MSFFSGFGVTSAGGAQEVKFQHKPAAIHIRRKKNNESVTVFCLSMFSAQGLDPLSIFKA